MKAGIQVRLDDSLGRSTQRGVAAGPEVEALRVDVLVVEEAACIGGRLPIRY